MNFQVTGFSGSVRSNHARMQELEGMIREAADKDELISWFKDKPDTFSNTDIAVAIALLGAKDVGADIRIVSLIKLFKHIEEKIFTDSEYHEHKIANEVENIDTLAINQKELNGLMNQIKKTDGIVLGSPVYFGDRSSVANKLLQLTNRNKVLEGKGFGAVAVGAKRNGGQETTLIYTLYEALMQDAVVVGNGPATSQYGGTAWAGDVNKILEDELGLDTCYGTGKRVGNLAEILKKGSNNKNKPGLKLTVFVTMDTPKRKYEEIIKNYFERYKDDYSIEIIKLTEYDIFRCVGCSICPNLFMKEKNAGEEKAYNCIIQTQRDSMRTLKDILLDSDGIVIAGVNSQEQDLVYRYQVFIERTRFIRRSDFLLTNTPIISFFINELGSRNNALHNLKVVTSYLRHNTFMLKPVELNIRKGEIYYEDDFSDYLELISKIKSGRELVDATVVSYKADGYGDKSLDNTSGIRR